MKKSSLFSITLIVFFVCCNLISVPLLFSLRNLITDYDNQQSLPKNNKTLQEEKKLKNLFQLEDDPPILTLLSLGEEEKGHWLEPGRIKALKKLTKKISSLKEITHFTSITNIQVLQQQQESLEVTSILDSLKVEKWKHYITQNPLLSPRLISKDARSIVIVLHKEKISKHETKKLFDKIRNILQENFPQSTVQISGQTAVQLEISSSLPKELFSLFAISILIMGLTLFLIFRGSIGFFSPLYITAMANIASFSLLSYMKIPFTILNSSLPILINITVVSMCTHTMLRFSKEYFKFSPSSNRKQKAMWSTQKALFLPNLLTSLTTCVGFATLLSADVPLISQYSLSVCAGIMFSWLVSNILLLPILLIFSVPIPRDWISKCPRYSLYILKNAKAICLSLLALLGTMLYFSKEKHWTAKILDSIPKNKESRIASEFIDKKMGAAIPLGIVVSAKEEHAWNEPENIKKMHTLIKSWRKKEYVGSVIGVPDFLTVMEKNIKKNDDREEKYITRNRIPTSRSAIAETYFLYSLSTRQALDRYITGDGRSVRISLFLNDIYDEKMKKLVGSIEKEARKAFPKYEVKSIEMAATVHPVNREISLKLINSFWISVIFIAILLLFIFRSLKLVILSVLPNLFPPLFLLSSMSFFGTSIRPGTSIIFAIAIGLAFNNTTYLIGRLRNIYKKRAASKTSIDRVLYLEGTSCFLSTISLLAGFLVFLFSEFEINRLFGVYMFISIISSLIGDLCFLPSILKLFPRILEPWRIKNILEGKSYQLNFLLDLVPKKKFIRSFILTFLMINSFHQNTFSANFKVNSVRKQKNSANKILDNVNKKIKANNERALILMTIIDKNGNTKKSKMKIWRKYKPNSHKVLLEITEPNDTRGIKLLSVDKNKVRSQWIFLPSSNKIRRIISKGQGKSFLGSELSYEDLGGFAGIRFRNKLQNKIKKDNQVYAIIESIPLSANSSYSRIKTWVSMKDYLIRKVEYYDNRNKLLKISKFSAYKKFNKNIWRATKMQTLNVQNKRKTRIFLKKLAVLNKGIEEQIFSLSNLEEG